MVAVRQSPTTDVALAKLETPIKDISPLQVGDRSPRPSAPSSGSPGTARSQHQPGRRRPAADRADDGGVAERFGHRHAGLRPQPNTTPCPYDSGARIFLEQRQAARRCWSPWSATGRAARIPRWRAAPARTTSPTGSATASGRAAPPEPVRVRGGSGAGAAGHCDTVWRSGRRVARVGDDPRGSRQLRESRCPSRVPVPTPPPASPPSRSPRPRSSSTGPSAGRRARRAPARGEVFSKGQQPVGRGSVQSPRQYGNRRSG